MATKKKAKAKSYVYALPDSVITVNGKEYRLGDSVDDWTDEQRERHRFKIKEAPAK